MLLHHLRLARAVIEQRLLIQFKYLHKPGNKFPDRSQRLRESRPSLFFWYASTHSFLFTRRKSFHDKKKRLEMMKQAIPRSLNFGENHRGLSPERISMQFSKAGQLAMAGWEEERTSLGDAGFIAKAAQDARRGRHPVTPARQRSETNLSRQRSLKTRLAVTEKIQMCAGTLFWRIVRIPVFTHPKNNINNVPHT